MARELWGGEDAEIATAVRYSRAVRDLMLKTQSQVADGITGGLEEPAVSTRQPKPKGPRPPKALAQPKA